MSWCQPYQPLPISTGTVGIDRCGNIEVYAAPNVVRNRVHWGCWPIQFQGWWLYQGPFTPPGRGSCGGGGWGSGGWGMGDWWRWLTPPVDPGFSAPPWWGSPVASPARTDIRQAAQARGTAMAEWMLNVRNNLNAMPR